LGCGTFSQSAPLFLVSERDDTVAAGRGASKPLRWRTLAGLRYTFILLSERIGNLLVPETEHAEDYTEAQAPVASGRLLALDLGTRRVGVAVSDELRLSVRPLPFLERTNWKKLLRAIAQLCESFDVKMVVVGLPLRLDGSEGDAATEARRIARNLSLSLKVPVHLQDERLTSRAAEETLRSEGLSASEIKGRVDSEAAAIILRDFLSQSGDLELPESI
jgi:putative Holliday junction resolvase